MAEPPPSSRTTWSTTRLGAARRRSARGRQSHGLEISAFQTRARPQTVSPGSPPPPAGGCDGRPGEKARACPFGGEDAPTGRGPREGSGGRKTGTVQVTVLSLCGLLPQRVQLRHETQQEARVLRTPHEADRAGGTRVLSADCDFSGSCSPAAGSARKEGTDGDAETSVISSPQPG